MAVGGSWTRVIEFGLGFVKRTGGRGPGGREWPSAPAELTSPGATTMSSCARMPYDTPTTRAGAMFRVFDQRRGVATMVCGEAFGFRRRCPDCRT